MVKYHRLKDQRIATIRLATVYDAPRIQAMHQWLSQRSLYNRYHRPYQPSLAEIEKLCSMDEKQGFVLLSTIDSPLETVVGLAYYLLEENPLYAEPAILVDDRFQGLGLGKEMMKLLTTSAVEHGINVFNAYVLSQNDRMLNLLWASGLPYEDRLRYNTHEFQIFINGQHPMMTGLNPMLSNEVRWLH